jgi:hypothetical protein
MARIEPLVKTSIPLGFVAVCVMALTSIIVYGSYIGLSRLAEKPPSPTAMKFLLLNLYSVQGVPKQLLPEGVRTMRVGTMPPRDVLAGTSRSTDPLVREFRRITLGCLASDGKSFDAPRIVERDGDIKRLIAAIDAASTVNSAT